MYYYISLWVLGALELEQTIKYYEIKKKIGLGVSSDCLPVSRFIKD